MLRNPFAGIAQRLPGAENKRSARPEIAGRTLLFRHRAPILLMVPTSQSGVIVIVEDPSISRLVKSVLRREGREVLVVDAQQAQTLMEQGDSRVKLLITNRPHAFAGLDGFIPVLYLTSAPDWELAARTRGLRVLQKPFQTKDLVEAVGQIVPRN